MGLSEKQASDKCSLVTGSTNSTVVVDSMDKPFMVNVSVASKIERVILVFQIVLKAYNFEPRGVIAVDNIVYSARIPPGCGPC